MAISLIRHRDIDEPRPVHERPVYVPMILDRTAATGLVKSQVTYLPAVPLRMSVM